jgi:hypothetical protein
MSRAYYINRDKDTDRRLHIEGVLKNLQNRTSDDAVRFEFQRCPAEDKESPLILEMSEMVEYTCDPSIGVCEKACPSSAGSIACFRSHLAAWRQAWKAAQNGSDSSHFALILEDDADFSIDSLDILPAFLEDLPSDADLVQLGIIGNYRPQDLVAPGLHNASGPSFHDHNHAGYPSNYSDADWAIVQNSGKKISGFYMGFHAYLIRISRVPELIIYFGSELPAIMQRGLDIDAVSLVDVHRYAILPSLAFQARFPSTRNQDPTNSTNSSGKSK